METFDESVLLLTDGSKVTIRAIGVGDAPMLQAFVRRLSPRSRRRRFFSALVELSATQLERLVNMDRRKGLAVAALSGRSVPVIIAEARCVLEPAAPDAEFAIAVADEFQRRGLGTQLLRILVAYASRTGIRRLFGEILAENDAMLALARRLGFQIRTNPKDPRTMLASIVPASR